MAVVDLQINYPVLGGQRVELSRHLREALDESSEWMTPAPYGGLEKHRKIAAEWMSREGAPISTSRVMISAGGHIAVMAALLAAELRGRKIAVDRITYPGFKEQAAALGAVLVPCEMDERGMTAESLERAAKEHGAAAAYLMPTVHNPLGIVMPMERRRQICEVAARHNLVLIEDDAYRFCEANPPATFATLAPERSYFVESLTKPIAPVMKVGFLVFPEDRAVAVTTALRMLANGAPVLLAEVATRLIASGDLDRLLAAKRAEAKVRQRIAAEIFAGLDVTAHPTSFHLWLELPERQSADAIAATLNREEVLVSPSSESVAAADVRANGMRVALGAIRDLNDLRKGLERVRKVIDEAAAKAV